MNNPNLTDAEDIRIYQLQNKTKIPLDLDFNEIKGLSNEVKDILQAVKPKTVAQASNLPGFTPTATLLLIRHIKKGKKNKVVNEY